MTGSVPKYVTDRRIHHCTWHVKWRSEIPFIPLTELRWHPPWHPSRDHPFCFHPSHRPVNQHPRRRSPPHGPLDNRRRCVPPVVNQSWWWSRGPPYRPNRPPTLHSKMRPAPGPFHPPHHPPPPRPMSWIKRQWRKRPPRGLAAGRTKCSRAGGGRRYWSFGSCSGSRT